MLDSPARMRQGKAREAQQRDKNKLKLNRVVRELSASRIKKIAAMSRLNVILPRF